MPKMKFDPAKVRGSDTNFPKVALEQDAIWRIVCAEEEPTYEWVHRLEKPKLSSVTGRLVMHEVDFRGEKKTVPQTVFVGAPKCAGNIDTLEDLGVDEDNCPVCAAAVRGDHTDYFSKPERKFAIHVLKYGTKSGSAVVTPTLNLETYVWRLSERRYGEVVRIFEERGKPPTRVDLILGPCTNKQFQNYKIGAAGECEIEKSEAGLQRAQETFEGNNAGDLSAYCGRQTDPRFMARDVQEIAALWDQGNGRGGAVTHAPEPDFSETLGAAGSKLIEEQPAASAPAVSLDDTVGSSTDLPPKDEAPKEEAPAAAPAAAAPAAKGPTVDFSDLMGQLNVK